MTTSTSPEDREAIARLVRSVYASYLEYDPALVEQCDAPECTIWDLFEPDLVNVVSVKPESLSAIGLWRYIDYMRSNGLGTERFELALWTKLVYPAAVAVMIFFAVPLVLGRLRAVGVGQRVLIGSLVGIVFHVLHQASGHLGLVYGMSPAASAILPTLAFLGVGIWMVRRLD